MITNEEAKSIVLSFFNGTGLFLDVRKLVGHSASGKPDVFLRWFSQQKEEDQITLGSVLADLALFEEEAGCDVINCSVLLADIARQRPSILSPVTIQKLERFILRGDHVSLWVNDEDSGEDEKKDPRSRWRYALILFNVLSAVGSPVTVKAFDTFVQKARDPEFIRVINLANRVKERPPF